MPANRLRLVLLDVEFPLSVAKRADIERCVDDYVDSLKALHWPPERVIVAVKRIAHDAGMHPSPRVVRTDTSISARDKLLVDMVGWSINRYYRTEADS